MVLVAAVAVTTGRAGVMVISSFRKIAEMDHYDKEDAAQVKVVGLEVAEEQVGWGGLRVLGFTVCSF